MKLFHVDAEKCNKDGICIRECPFVILRQNDDGLPEMLAGAEAACIHCGHCLSVCPTGAVTFQGADPAGRPAVDAGRLPDAEAFAHLAMTRRSIRVYKKKPVAREIAQQLLDVVRWSPTAKNMQPVQWLVTDSPEKINKMAGFTVDYLNKAKLFPAINAAWKKGKDMILRDAPLVVTAYASTAALNPPVDCTIALTTMELAAMTHGLGACWAGFYMRAANEHPALTAMLGLPEDHRVYGALMIGYPKFRYHRIPERRPATVTWF